MLLQERLGPGFHPAERVGEGSGTLTGFEKNAGDAGLKIVGDARKVVLLRFPVPALDAVGIVANVVVVGVGGELDKAAFRHLAARIPGEKAACALVDARGDERDSGLCAILPQQREGEGVVALVAVVKGEQHRLLRQRRTAVELPGGKLARKDRRIAPVAQKIEIAPQSGDRHGVIRCLRGIVGEVVVLKDEKAPVWRGLFSAAFQNGRRRGGELRHGAPVELRRYGRRCGRQTVRLLKQRYAQGDDKQADG